MENRIKNLEKRIQKLEKIVSNSKIVKTRDDKWDELLTVVRIQKKSSRVQA
tara:strand:+ start:412 stop:564 length:153 start_codon:yes stop_codon:yes gene_type:complete